jgi:hypothetical protein
MVSFTYEMAINVEVGIRDKTEVVVFLAMEVKSDSITTNESRVLANSSWFVTFCRSCKKVIYITSSASTQVYNNYLKNIIYL